MLVRSFGSLFLGLSVLGGVACSARDTQTAGSSSASASARVVASVAADDSLGQELVALADLDEKLAGKFGEERAAVYEEAQNKCLTTVGKRGVSVIGQLAKRLESARKAPGPLHAAITRCLLDLKGSFDFSGQDKAFADAALPSLGSDDPEVITHACLLFSSELAKQHRTEIEAARARMEDKSRKAQDPKEVDRLKNAAASCNLALI